MQELWFLHSTCHLMLTDIYMKFLEDILNKFRDDKILWQTKFQGK